MSHDCEHWPCWPTWLKWLAVIAGLGLVVFVVRGLRDAWRRFGNPFDPNDP